MHGWVCRKLYGTHLNINLSIKVQRQNQIFNNLTHDYSADIQFWKSRKSLEGLSIRTIVFSIFTQVIVVLYVLDNDTNMMVAMSVCIGLVIEGWKITKVMDITVR